MYFTFFQLAFVFLAFGNSPEKLVSRDRLVIVISGTIHDDQFLVDDLVKLMDQPGADSIVLKVVTCPFSHPSKFDEMPAFTGMQHVAAFACDSDGVLLTGDVKAALPCPPDCGGKKMTSTVGEYLASH